MNEDCYGEVIDYYGGLRDLKQGEIRFLHNLSFIDDPTRILRAIRFAERYNFKLAKITREAIPTALEADVFSKVSAERFTEELMLIYAERNYQAMGRKLREAGVLANWFKADLAWNYDEQQNVGSWPLEKRWLVSIKNLTAEQAEIAVKGLKLNRNLSGITREYLGIKEKLRRYVQKQKKAWDIAALDQILAAMPAVIGEVLAMDNEFASVIKRYIIALSAMDMRVTGSDLIHAGIREGPMIGRILKEIRNLWLEGRIKTRDEEQAYIKTILNKGDKTVEKKNF